MDSKQIYVKTPTGDEAVRQSTRVVQRNLRMVLVQVDGKLSVAELSAKIGNPRLVEAALRDLEEGGFIAPKLGAVLVREEQRARPQTNERVSAISQFSTFGARPVDAGSSAAPTSAVSQFSSFGKPILPASRLPGQSPSAVSKKEARPGVADEVPPSRPASQLRWWFGIPAGLLVLLLSVILFYPYGNLKPGIEAATSRLLQTPVRIGGVAMSFWPRPALSLSAVSVGEAGDVLVEQVKIASPLALLGSGPHVLSGVEVIGAAIPADVLVASPLFRKSAKADDQNISVRQLHFEKLTVTARDMALPGLSGNIVFGSDGGVEEAALENLDLGLRLQAIPVVDGFRLNIEGFGWKPLGGALGFDSLQARGLLQKGRLLVENVDTTFLGGILKGNWLIDWRGSGLAMAGEAELRRLDCRKVSLALVPSLALEGELSGSLRLRANGKDWDYLLANVEANVDVDIARGILHGVDLGEVVRRGGGTAVTSGSTKFDRLRASLVIDPRQVTGRDIQMSAGMVAASGQFVAGRERPLDASLVVTMQTSVSTVRTPVRITGSLSDMRAVSGK